MDPENKGTAGTEYTRRLERLAGARWKQALDVQAPYRWNLRRWIGARAVLDVGCGIGRHLEHLPTGSVGVDHNPDSVRVCRERGLTAHTADELHAGSGPGHGSFDALLAAHLVEHLPAGAGRATLAPYLPFLRPGARLVLICPQERGFRSDPTHTVFIDDAALGTLAGELGADLVAQRSFPFPRPVGRWFTHNEFVTVADLPGSAS